MKHWRWPIVFGAVALVIWYFQRPSLRALVNTCTIEAEKTYVVRPDNNRNYLAQLAFIAECMRTYDYAVRFDLPGCDGNALPAPQTNEQCYRYDWRAKLGLPRSN